jgi:hypothetical protein
MVDIPEMWLRRCAAVAGMTPARDPSPFTILPDAKTD